MFLEETLIEVYPGYGRHARAIDTVASFCGLEVWQVADPLTQRIARRCKGAGHPVTPLAHRCIATGPAGTTGGDAPIRFENSGPVEGPRQQHLQLVVSSRKGGRLPLPTQGAKH